MKITGDPKAHKGDTATDLGKQRADLLLARRIVDVLNKKRATIEVRTVLEFSFTLAAISDAVLEIRVRMRIKQQKR